MQNENELYHYGRLGMRWGQHRYHDKYGALNKSGQAKRKELATEYKKMSSIPTLSEKGEKHKEDVAAKYEHLTGKPISSHGVAATKPKKIEDMTNEELSSYNTRKQLETTYQNYQPKPQLSRGKQFASTVFTKILAPEAISVGRKYISKVLVDPRIAEAAAKEALKLAEKTAKVVT